MALTVRAIHTFVAEHGDELDFHAGDHIVVLEKDEAFGDGWWRVSTPLRPPPRSPSSSRDGIQRAKKASSRQPTSPSLPSLPRPPRPPPQRRQRPRRRSRKIPSTASSRPPSSPPSTPRHLPRPSPLQPQRRLSPKAMIPLPALGPPTTASPSPTSPSPTSRPRARPMRKAASSSRRQRLPVPPLRMSATS